MITQNAKSYFLSKKIKNNLKCGLLQFCLALEGLIGTKAKQLYKRVKTTEFTL